MNLSLGKIYRLQKCSSSRNTFSILAIDHRTSLAKSLKLQNNSNQFSRLSEFKSDIVQNLGQFVNSILIDPEIGAPSCIVEGHFSSNNGLIISLEKSGYSGSPTLRENELLNHWDVEKSIRLGADSVKLLIYYHPEATNSSSTEKMVTTLVEECEKHEIPLFLEILTYSKSPNLALAGDERRNIIIKSARILSQLKPDILKVEFPADIKTHKDKNYWKEACSELTEASKVPWVLLSASVDFETYFDQVQIACEKGCSGIAVGRAVWKEVVEMESRKDRIDFLSSFGVQRMNRLTELCNQKAKPWTQYYSDSEVFEKWYENY